MQIAIEFPTENTYGMLIGRQTKNCKQTKLIIYDSYIEIKQ